MSVKVVKKKGRKQVQPKKFYYELTIRVYDKNGRLVATRRKKSGLMTHGMKVPLIAFIACHTVNITCEDGVTREFHGRNYDIYNHVSGWDKKIAVGSGTTPPADGDYALEAKVAETLEVTVTELTNGVSISCSIGFATEQTLSECGYFHYTTSGTDAAEHWYMIARDVFTAVTVPPGGAISITYKFLYA